MPGRAFVSRVLLARLALGQTASVRMAAGASPDTSRATLGPSMEKQKAVLQCRDAGSGGAAWPLPSRRREGKVSLTQDIKGGGGEVSGSIMLAISTPSPMASAL